MREARRDTDGTITEALFDDERWYPYVMISGSDGTRTVKPPSSSASRITANFRV